MSGTASNAAINRSGKFSSGFTDILAAVSLANLCFLTVWRELLFASRIDQYWLPDYSGPTYVAAILNIALFTVILWATIKYLLRSQHRWRKITGSLVILGFLIFPLSFLRLILAINENTIHLIKDNLIVSAPLGALLIAGGVYLLLFHLVKIAQFIVLVCLIISPFAVLNLGQAGWFLLGGKSAIAKPAAPALPVPTARKPTRIVWLLMDELDLRLAFIDRPKGLELPEFDRLRGQSLFAGNTKSYSLNTEEAIPSFLVQKIVKRARPMGPAQLHLSFHDVETDKDGELSQFPNFFSQATRGGAHAAILGYYHPYCRLFGKHTAHCERFALNTYTPRASRNIAREMLVQLAGITPLYKRINGVIIYSEMEKAITKHVGDPQYDLVYIHAPVPHGPNIWKDKTQSFTLLNTAKDGYFDNLRLADRLLGKIRLAMEETGVWDDTVVLLTADHEWRHVSLYDNKRVRKIPFVLKMPNQRHTLDFRAAFAPMRLTKDLMLQIQDGTIDTAAGVAHWINKRLPSAQ